MAERLSGNYEAYQQSGVKEHTVFDRTKLRKNIGAGVEYGGVAVALLTLNAIGIMVGTGMWVGGRWMRYYDNKK
jgi:hypothetical protein